MKNQNVKRITLKDGFNPLEETSSKVSRPTTTASASDGSKTQRVNTRNLLDDPKQTIIPAIKVQSLNSNDKLTPYKSTNNSNPSSQQEVMTKFELFGLEKQINYETGYFGLINENNYIHIILTNYCLEFHFDNSMIEENFHPDFFKIPLFLIQKIEKLTDKKIHGKYILEINTKDNRLIRLFINSEQFFLYLNLISMAYSKDTLSFYNFAKIYRECSPVNIDGWMIYNPRKEYKRQGINFDSDNNFLRITNLNENFSLCPTYPRVLVVPSEITDEEIKDASLFRTKNRIPTFVWKNKNNNSIWRSSQCKSGLTSQRSASDEKYLNVLTQRAKKLVVFDCRPYLSALANRLKGGGFEIIENYENVEIVFCEIENIHSVRNSLSKMYSLFSTKMSENKKYYSQLEQTGWYECIYYIMKAAADVSICIQKRNNILIHCSDGWDRCPQVVSTSLILLDPFFRTMEGFCVLIEKDWLSYGHQFGSRNGVYLKENSEDQRSPVFLQFLDVVHQLIFQFPDSFQFNNTLLLFLSSHYNSCLYGTFLFNNELEREDRMIKQKTVSVWTDIFDEKFYQKFLNPFYHSDKVIEILTPNYGLNKIRVWEEYFGKWTANPYHQNTLKVEPDRFYEIHKSRDTKIIDENGNKVEEMGRVLKDISKYILNMQAYEEFTDETRSYLFDLSKMEQELTKKENNSTTTTTTSTSNNNNSDFNA